MAVGEQLAGRILAIGGVLEAITGLGLLAVPSTVAFILLRAPLDATGVVVARIAGAGLLALGIACWNARGTTNSPAGIGVSWGLTAYNLIACVVLALACPPLSGGGLVAAGASVLHGVFGIGLVVSKLSRAE